MHASVSADAPALEQRLPMRQALEGRSRRTIQTPRHSNCAAGCFSVHDPTHPLSCIRPSVTYTVPRLSALFDLSMS